MSMKSKASFQRRIAQYLRPEGLKLELYFVATEDESEEDETTSARIAYMCPFKY